jgi:hypothetical protein
MLDSATNFAFGFFGWPLEGKVLLEVTVEAGGVRKRLHLPYLSHFLYFSRVFCYDILIFIIQIISSWILSHKLNL